MTKSNNFRRYPGIKGKRPDHKKVKQVEAKERDEASTKLSVKEKLAKLPKDGCKRQRARYEKLLAK